MGYDCVILFRNTSNGRVGFVGQESDPDKMEVFPNEDEAIKAADDVPILRAHPYQIVQLDEI